VKRETALARVAAAIGLVMVMAGCGDTGTSGSETAAQRSKAASPTPKPASRCLPVVKSLRKSLTESITIRAARVVKVAGVKSKDADQSRIPGYRRFGLYFVSAKVKGPGSAPLALTWAVNGRAFQGGTGLVMAANSSARTFSNLGDRGNPGVGSGDDGWYESVKCAGALPRGF
jgi:hypothetical protein